VALAGYADSARWSIIVGSVVPVEGVVLGVRGTCTAWSGIQHLPPGHALIARDSVIETYQVAHVAALDPGAATRAELVAEVRRRLLVAVERYTGPTVTSAH
jgi:asparagine synthetase B (glutamine-hydrolysing)